jgi:SAM-dependent methyltransferase
MKMRELPDENSTRQTSHLETLRESELEDALRLIAAPARLLEIGAGSGWQARELARRGFEVCAVDISAETHVGLYFDVAQYDGTRLPYAAGSFDIIFSSNVLEHVADLPGLLADCGRVLRPGGTMLHLMPSVSWRFWTCIAHYGFLAKSAFSRRAAVDAAGIRVSPASTLRKRGLLGTLARILAAAPHGEFPTVAHELFAFRQGAWRRRFEASGWRVRSAGASSLFYTGYGLAPGMSLERRKSLARVLGAGCNWFIVERHT